MPETVIRIRAEGGAQAKGEVEAPAQGLDRLSQSGGQAAQVLGQLGGAGQIVATALGGAGMVAAVMAGKYALDQFSQSAETAFGAMQKLGGAAGANVLATYGPGANRLAALQGAQYGVGSQEAIQARSQLLGTLGAGARTEAANVQALMLGGVLGPGGAALGAEAIGGFMAGNPAMSAVGAGNLYWSALRSMGAQGAAALPQISGAAGELGFGMGESMAFTEMLTRQGGNPMMAIEVMRNLRGLTPDTAGILGRAGVTEGMGLGERLKAVQGTNLDVYQRRLLFGRGLRGMGGVMANMGEFEGLAGSFDAAAAGGTDLVSEYARNVFGRDETSLQELGQRRFNALKEFTKTGKSLAPGQLGGLVTSPGDTGDIIGSRGELGQDPAAFFRGVEDAVARGAERGTNSGSTTGGREKTRLEGGT